MAAALQSAATTGPRAAGVAIDRQRTGAAAAVLFGAVNAIAWIAFLLSVKAGGLTPPVVGKLAQTYDYLQATVPLIMPLALVLAVVGIFTLLFVHALDERFRPTSPALSWLASLCGVAGVLLLELDYMAFFFVQERMVLGSDRAAVEALIPGFSVLAPVAALLASLFLAAWIGLISRISRGPAGLTRALRYLGFLAAVLLVVGEFNQVGADHPLEVFLVGTSLLMDVWLIWAGVLAWRIGSQNRNRPSPL
jgi:hypothetical protein